MPFPRTVAWRRLDLDHGLGAVRVSSFGDDLTAQGHEVCVNAGRVWAIWFSVVVDSSWRTKGIAATAIGANDVQYLGLRSDRSGSWTLDDEPAPKLDGCTDVDIVSTPYTNTVPIRRLGLAVGESADIRAAWVDVPNLEVSVSNQRYTRLEPANGVDRYEFATPDSGDTYLLTVDEDGIVIDYERFAERVVPREGA